MASDTIFPYLSCGYDVSTASDNDELFKGLRSRRICRPECIKPTHDTVHDIRKLLNEGPLKGFTCVDGKRRYLKCHSVTASLKAHVIFATFKSAFLETTVHVHCGGFIMSFSHYLQQSSSHPYSIQKDCLLDAGRYTRDKLKKTCPILSLHPYCTCTLQI